MSGPEIPNMTKGLLWLASIHAWPQKALEVPERNLIKVLESLRLFMRAIELTRSTGLSTPPDGEQNVSGHVWKSYGSGKFCLSLHTGI